MYVFFAVIIQRQIQLIVPDRSRLFKEVKCFACLAASRHIHMEYFARFFFFFSFRSTTIRALLMIECVRVSCYREDAKA